MILQLSPTSDSWCTVHFFFLWIIRHGPHPKYSWIY